MMIILVVVLHLKSRNLTPLAPTPAVSTLSVVVVVVHSKLLSLAVQELHYAILILPLLLLVVLAPVVLRVDNPWAILA